ncbi:hypothetical protein K3495_g10914 [Podosphaera aphanis]|nr:hypothetical protein K3495_g10914 [Podosphaera aphanis]
MFDNPLYSNVNIKLAEVVVHAHNVVLSSRSKYFREKLQLTETATPSDSQAKIIECLDGSSAAHWRVFEYIYTGNYSEQLVKPELKDDVELLKHVRVYRLAENFGMEDLKGFAAKKFEAQLKGLPHLSKDTIPQYAECVREIFATTKQPDNALRKAVVIVAISHSSTLQSPKLGKYSSEVLQLDEFKALLREGGDFVMDYLKSVITAAKMGAEETKE